MTIPDTERPPVAIGHVRLKVGDVAAARQLFEQYGLRAIAEFGDFAVMELRGGTHLVLSKADEPIAPETEAPFDLMVDDIHETRRDYQHRGFEMSALTEGRIHSSFWLSGPEGYRIKITSSHAGARAV